MNPLAEGIRQHGTHSTLTPMAGTAGPARSPRLDLDAIIVPASRPAAHLDHAVTLARAAGCWLLVLCSRQLNSTEARQVPRRPLIPQGDRHRPAARVLTQVALFSRIGCHP